MFTFTQFTTDEINLDARRRVMVAEFVDTEADRVHSHEFQFSVNETPEVIKKRVKDYLDSELNFTPEPVIDLVVEEVPEPEKTPEELARDAWLEQWRTYEKADKGMKALRDAGIEPTQEELTRFEALKAWVADNRKPEYVAYL